MHKVVSHAEEQKAIMSDFSLRNSFTDEEGIFSHSRRLLFKSEYETEVSDLENSHGADKKIKSSFVTGTDFRTPGSAKNMIKIVESFEIKDPSAPSNLQKYPYGQGVKIEDSTVYSEEEKSSNMFTKHPKDQYQISKTQNRSLSGTEVSQNYALHNEKIQLGSEYFNLEHSDDLKDSKKYHNLGNQEQGHNSEFDDNMERLSALEKELVSSKSALEPHSDSTGELAYGSNNSNLTLDKKHIRNTESPYFNIGKILCFRIFEIQ